MLFVKIISRVTPPNTEERILLRKLKKHREAQNQHSQSRVGSDDDVSDNISTLLQQLQRFEELQPPKVKTLHKNCFRLKFQYFQVCSESILASTKQT